MMVKDDVTQGQRSKCHINCWLVTKQCAQSLERPVYRVPCPVLFGGQQELVTEMCDARSVTFLKKKIMSGIKEEILTTEQHRAA